MECKRCKGKVEKFGKVMTTKGKRQRYHCTQCGHVFLGEIINGN